MRAKSAGHLARCCSWHCLTPAVIAVAVLAGRYSVLFGPSQVPVHTAAPSRLDVAGGARTQAVGARSTAQTKREMGGGFAEEIFE